MGGDELLGVELELKEDGFDGAELDCAELGDGDEGEDGAGAEDEDWGDDEDRGDDEDAGNDEDEGCAYGDDGGAGEDEGPGDELLGGLALLGELAPGLLPSKTTKLALLPLGTVTTQKLAPFGLIGSAPVISFTPCFEGSMAHGRPLQPPPSQIISTPQVGILLRKGVVGSR